jgi:hypothetical protein
VDDVDLAAADDVIPIVVPGLDVRPQPRQPEQDLPRGERVIVDLPDREVGVASTRSSTAGADARRGYPEQARREDEERAISQLHFMDDTPRGRAMPPVAARPP